MESDIITLLHGSGGIQSDRLINNIILEKLNNNILCNLDDGGKIRLNGNVAISTDSYVINPIFFNGGDIGKLSICGTINDVLMCGAIPKYITLGFILEEGFDIHSFEKIVDSIKVITELCNVKVVTGDTKVVEKGKGDGIYINTTGVGEMVEGIELDSKRLEVGDKVIVTGPIGTHGISILCERNNLLQSDLKSDCAPLIEPMKEIFKYGKGLKFIRDVTRGGLGTILNEAINDIELSIEINKGELPIDDRVKGISEILGINPLYSANEGMALVICKKDIAENVLEDLKKYNFTKDASIIGEVVDYEEGLVLLKNELGVRTIIERLNNNLLPRIC